MFGLPYIIAPTEAEAQCAFMEMNNLVDGVVTDDSDVFLFGARSVYKNIFDDRKYVETYFMKVHSHLLVVYFLNCEIMLHKLLSKVEMNLGCGHNLVSCIRTLKVNSG